MSTSSRRRKKAHSGPPQRTRPPTPDATYYFGLLMIAGFAYLIWYLLLPDLWREAIVGLAAAIVLLVHLHALQAYFGVVPGGWKGAMARASLRWAGFHRQKDGRPLEDARKRPEARNAILATAVVGVLIVIGLALWLLPELRGA